MRANDREAVADIAAQPSRPSRLAPYSRWLPDALAVVWVIVVGVAVVLPALVHGTSLGPFDLLSKFGLSKQPGVVVHNSAASDQIDEMIPWSNLVWTQVHHGHLPLWNPYNGLGLPLAFNWQSAPFGVPALVGYLVPVGLAYTTGVLVTVIIAGTGGYVLGRVLRLGVVASAVIGTVFELSGPLTTQLGYPIGSVMSWAGWLFAAAILVLRGRHRARNVAFLAIVLALATYGGHPESIFMLALVLVLFLVVMLAQLALGTHGLATIRRPVVDLSLAALAGFGLAAPLILPGVQLASASIRGSASGVPNLPAHYPLYTVFPTFDGIPVAGNRAFGVSLFYNETTAYLGVIAIVLAMTAVAVKWRDPLVRGFSVVTGIMAVLVFMPGVASVWNAIPGLGRVAWLRGLVPLALGVAVLSGVGTEVLMRRSADRRVRRWMGAGFAAAGLGLLALWLGGRGNLPTVEAHIRAQSFVWPAIETGCGLAVVGGLALMDGRLRRPVVTFPVGKVRVGVGTCAGLTLLACETAFLIAVGAPFWSSSADSFIPNSAEATLQRAVGTSTVAFGTNTCLSSALGIVPEANAAFGVHELNVYDPIVPGSYFQSWTAATRQTAGVPQFNLFCPQVDTATVARRYGVAFVLEPAGAPGPVGALYDQRVGDEDLYRVPGAAPATVTPMPSDGSPPGLDAPGTPVAIDASNPSSWKLATSSASPLILRLRLSNVPGWHATVDGRPLALEPFSGMMLQTAVPSGAHTITVTYWPRAFTVGLVLATCTAAGLAVAVVASGRRLRTLARRRPPT